MGNKIRALLKRAGLTQKDLVAATGRTPAAISRYCSNLSTPDAETARAIAKCLGVSLADLDVREQERTGPRSIDGTLDWKIIEKALTKRGMSAADLAREIGVTRQAISAFRSGRSLPRAATLRRLARALDLDPSDLVRAS